MQPKHSAIVAGLTLALSFGAVAAPVTAVAEEPTPGVASDATDIDKGLYTQQSFSGVLRSVQGVSLVNVTDEMKYFSKYESHGNYNQGFSYGDGYNALGYYQFDRRWSLIPFMKQAYNYNPEKYSMLKDAIDRGSEISNAGNAMSENGQLTELGRIAQDSFLGAYNTDPEEFSALQDAYAYNSYYAVTESWLKSALGIDITGRADCVKGMVWSITNMCGTYGCQDFFRWANLSNDMTDREFVTALSGSVVNNVAKKYPNQSKYHPGWRNRYSNELKDCLVYITEDEKEAANKNEAADKNAAADKNEAADKKPEESESPSTPDSSQTPEESQPAQKPDTDNNESNGGETNGSATGTGNSNSGSTDNGSSKPSSGSSDSSAGGDSGTNTGSGSVTASGSDSSKDDSNKGTDAPVTPTNKKPSVSEVFGSTLGSLMAGPSGNSSSNKDNDGQNSVTKTDTAKDDSKDNKSEDTSEKPETDKGSGFEEKKDDSEEKGNKSGGGKNNGDRTDSAGDNKENTGDNKDGAGDNKDNNSGGKNDSGSGNGNAGNNGAIMPKTGDLIVMASLASASLATLGATSIVSGKHKLDQQKKAAGQNASEE